MAERHEPKQKPKKKVLRAMTHHFHPDGTATHEHHYADDEETPHTHPPRMMGTSADLEDAQQHLADHWPGESAPEPNEMPQGGEPDDGGAGGLEAGEE